ncbi:MAG: helicase [Desulfobulbus propionicus]|nr:MAG: helicase [Desulfobulbus propionicus]
MKKGEKELSRRHSPCIRVDHECALWNGGEELEAALRSQLTIDNPKYTAARQYGRWVGKKLQPRLVFYRDEQGGLFFPRGFANQAVRLCRQINGCEPLVEDRRRRCDALELEFQGTLRPYQQKGVEQVLRHSFGVLEAATGSGKTIMALALIAARQQPALVLVHSRELMYQWQERIHAFLGVDAGQAGDGRVDLKPVTVAVVNTARKRVAELSRHFGHVVVDECHRVPASLFTDVVAGLDSMYMLGLSATAFRREDGMTAVIYIYMGDLLHRVESEELEASGAVLRPELIQRPTSFRYGYRGQYARLIKALALNEERNRLIAADVRRLLAAGHQGTILVVSDRVAHCQELARYIDEPALTAVLTGQQGTEERTATVARVRNGEVRVLVATLQLIGEGFDCPGLSTLLLATPIKFEGRLLQVVGRILRPDSGKQARVYDYIDEHIPVLRRSAKSREQLFARWRVR